MLRILVVVELWVRGVITGLTSVLICSSLCSTSVQAFSGSCGSREVAGDGSTSLHIHHGHALLPQRQSGGNGTLSDIALFPSFLFIFLSLF